MSLPPVVISNNLKSLSRISFVCHASYYIIENLQRCSYVTCSIVVCITVILSLISLSSKIAIFRKSGFTEVVSGIRSRPFRPVKLQEMIPCLDALGLESIVQRPLW